MHSYGWDAEGKMLSVDTNSVTLTYDALGRMVEQNRGGVYTEIVYGPTGGKLALMNVQTLAKAFVPLPAGATAVYAPGTTGPVYWRHSDWLGSSRLATTPSRTKYFDVAYAPFGEDYADSGTTDLNFTGQNQDTESHYYDFLFREYSMVQGRWMSPDPAGLAVATPQNPQSWNRYAYAQNNPMAFLDPYGLDCVYFGGSTPVTVVSGDCISTTDDGYYVDGTVDLNSFYYNTLNGVTTFFYSPTNGGSGQAAFFGSDGGASGIGSVATSTFGWALAFANDPAIHLHPVALDRGQGDDRGDRQVRQGKPQLLQEPPKPVDRCHSYVQIGEGLAATMALNEGGALITGEASPVALYFHAIAIGEGAASGILIVYGDVFCQP